MGEIPALIIGSGLSVLGAARLLGRAGVRAYCYGPAQNERYSRWYRPAPGGGDRSVACADRLAAYLAACPLERAVLIPASDAAVRDIALLPDDLKERFPASVSPPGIADQLTDKALFSEMLVRLGEPGPHTHRIDDLSDLAGIPDAMFPGAFLKPTDSASYMARFGVKGCLVTSRADAEAKAGIALGEGHRLVLQEYVPSTRNPDGSGARGDHILIDGFVDRNGRMTAMFARRRQRMFPLDFGNTTYMVSIPIEAVPQPAASLRGVAQRLGCRGIVSGEFKQDPRDGIYKLLEINSRVWWFVEYAGRCGVDLCSMSYLDAAGERVEPVTAYKVGARFAHFYYDYHAIKALHRRGDIGLVPAAWSWIGAQDPWFNWTDPVPAFHDTIQHVRQRQRRIEKKPSTA